METGCRISVIIPAKNEQENIKRCLEGVFSQTISPAEVQENIKRCLEGVFSQTISPAEVIVVDGDSTDDTIESAGFFDVKILSENYGTVDGARQTGLEAATGELIAYTDTDSVPDPAWLERLVEGPGEGIIATGGSLVNIGVGTRGESVSLALNTFLGGARSVQERVYAYRRFVKNMMGEYYSNN